jgi:PAS domain S-box-containing protein
MKPLKKLAGTEWQPLEALRSLLPDGAFGPAELAELTPLCSVQHYPIGHVLLREGEPSDGRVYFLLEGGVTVSLEGKFILRLTGHGGIVGEMALISPADRAATVKTEQPSVCLVMDAGQALQTEAKGSFKFRYYFGHLCNLILNEKLRATGERARLYEDAILHSRDVEEESASLHELVARNLAQLRLYSHVVESARDAVVITDLEGRILQANPALQQSFGIAQKAFQGRRITELLGWGSTSEQAWAELRKQLEVGGWQGETLVSPLEGEPIPAHCTMSLVQDEKGQSLGYSVLLRDIRAEKAYQNRILLQSRQLERALGSVQELDRIKSHFLTLVSHELRTPITVILAYSETVVGGMAEPQQYQEFFGAIHSEARHLSEMVDKVLAITKLESGQMLLNFQPASLAELVRGQVAMHRSKGQLKNLTMEFEGPEAGAQTVFDPDKIGEAVHQILDNAVKYTERGGIRVTLEQNPRQSLLRIADTGKGIPEDIVRSIFRKFEREENAEHHSSGLGLGLPLCYLIVKAHSGDLQIASRPGEGTTVVLSLPNQPPNAAPTP